MHRLIIPSITRKFIVARSFSNTTAPVKTEFKWSDFEFVEQVATLAMIVGGITGAIGTGHSTYQDNARKDRRVRIAKTVCGGVTGGAIGAAISLVAGYFWYVSIPAACAVYAFSDSD